MHAKVRRLSVWAGIGVLLAGCMKQPKTENIENVRVCLPLEQMMLYPEHLQDTIHAPKYKYVVYVDSAECSSCKIIHMGIWNYYRNELQDRKVGFYMILCPEKEKRQTIMDAYDAYRQRIPIYIDTLGVFRRDNSEIAAMPEEYHCFLLDEDNRVVIVGDASKDYFARERIFQFLSERADSTSNEERP